MHAAMWLGLVPLVLSAALVPLPAAARSTQLVRLAADRALELDFAATRGEVEIFQGRDGQLAVTVDAQSSPGSAIDDAELRKALVIEQEGNRVRVRFAPDDGLIALASKLSLRLDVPHWSRIASFVGDGRTTLVGVMGPARLAMEHGTIRASYVSTDLRAETHAGNLDLRVVGGEVHASTDKGDIRGERLARGGVVEAGDGDIALTVVGPTQARVRFGHGGIDVSGARGALDAATDGGLLHVKAVPHADWMLASASGTIRVELPPDAPFDLDALTERGSIKVERPDLAGAAPLHAARTLERRANGGGYRIAVRDRDGAIVVE